MQADGNLKQAPSTRDRQSHRALSTRPAVNHRAGSESNRLVIYSAELLPAARLGIGNIEIVQLNPSVAGELASSLAFAAVRHSAAKDALARARSFGNLRPASRLRPLTVSVPSRVSRSARRAGVRGRRPAARTFCPAPAQFSDRGALSGPQHEDQPPDARDSNHKRGYACKETGAGCIAHGFTLLSLTPGPSPFVAMKIAPALLARARFMK